MTPPSPADFLIRLAEPTRLRILNCLAAAPLYVSDLVALLGLPQPTVSRHLRVLRDLGAVQDAALPPWVVYRLASPTGPSGRLLRAVLEGLRQTPGFGAERARAAERSRADAAARIMAAEADAG